MNCAAGGGLTPLPIKMTATPMVNKVQIQLPQTPVSKEAIKKPASSKAKTGGGGKKSSSGSGAVIKQCEICGTQFRSAKSYKRHMDQCHVANGPRHVCCLCQRAFKRSDNLSAHYRSVHFGVKPNKCANCGKGYRTKNELYRHAENCSARPSHSTAAADAPPSTAPSAASAQPPTTTVTATAVAVPQLPPLPQIPEPPANLQPRPPPTASISAGATPVVSVALPQQPILPIIPAEVTTPPQPPPLPPLRDDELPYREA